jgi:hypothetical protein
MCNDEGDLVGETAQEKAAEAEQDNQDMAVVSEHGEDEREGEEAHEEVHEED